MQFCSGGLKNKKAYLPLLASGENIGGYALTEPDAGSDPAALVSTARRDGDDYIINGEKCGFHCPPELI